MGIDVYTYALRGDELVDPAKLSVNWDKILGHSIELAGYHPVGYIRESYHGHVHPVNVFIPESFEHESYEKFGKPDEDGYYPASGCYIPLTTLKERLPETLEVAKQRWDQYGEDPAEVESWWGYQQYIDFVKVHEAIAGGDMKAYIRNSY